MMDIDITLDQLPENILEEILSLTLNLANLRLVCKTFKRIIDYSSRLLKDNWLSVDNTLTLNSADIHYSYQNLVLHSLSGIELYWMSKYQHKDRIKAIRITSGDRCPTILQYIISNFDSLEVLNFDMDRFYNEDFFMNAKMKLAPNEKSKLKTLRVGYYQNDQYNILEMFADIPTIKNLYILDFNSLYFPENVQWKLEKLIIPDRDEPDFATEIEDDNCKQFLLSQKETLKVLRCYDSLDYSDLIMKNLLNLEHLTLNIKKIGPIDDEFLISNQKLQHLGLNYMQRFKLKSLEVFLRHYNKIKRFSLISKSHLENKKNMLLDIEFENLTHLFLQTPIVLYVLKAKLPKLKVLGLYFMDENINFDELSVQTMKNVEKISISDFTPKYVLAIVGKCPKLSQLCVEFRDWYGQVKEFISDILEIAPQIEYIGITEDNLNDQKNREEFLNNSSDGGIVLKIYENFTSMIAEDWGREFAEYLYFWESNSVML